jgi:hypothetical protein
MDLARRITQLTMLAIAALALTAPAALAQTEPLFHHMAPLITVKQEVHQAPDTNCPLATPVPPPVPGPPVTAGGCRLHMTAPSVVTSTHLAAGGAEVIVSTCGWEFDVRIDAVGEGYVAHHELTGPVATCTRRACGQVVPPTSEGRAWSMYVREAETEPRERMVLLYCLENRADGSAAAHCEVTLPLSQPSLHRYRLNAVDASGHGTAFPHCELDGTFDVEAALGVTGEAQAEQNVEIAHQ